MAASVCSARFSVTVIADSDCTFAWQDPPNDLELSPGDQPVTLKHTVDYVVGTGSTGQAAFWARTSKNLPTGINVSVDFTNTATPQRASATAVYTTDVNIEISVDSTYSSEDNFGFDVVVGLDTNGEAVAPNPDASLYAL